MSWNVKLNHFVSNVPIMCKTKIIHQMKGHACPDKLCKNALRTMEKL